MEKFFVNIYLGKHTVWSKELHETTVVPIEKFLHRELVKKFTASVIFGVLKDAEDIKDHVLRYGGEELGGKAKKAMEDWAKRAVHRDFPEFAKTFPDFIVDLC